MDKKRIVGKIIYIVFSVGLASVLIFTAQPCYLLSTLSYGNWGIFWSYADVQRMMFFLFPGLALFFALSTIKKKNTILDVFLNVAAPLVLLLSLKIAQYHFNLVVVIVMVVLFYAGSGCINLWFDDNTMGLENRKKCRLCYYKARKRIVLPLIIILCPLAVWCSWNEVYDKDKYLTYYSTFAESENELPEEENRWEVVSEETWNDLSVESRFEEVKKMTTYFLQDLGVDGINVYGVKELTDNRLGYYSEHSESMGINITYIANATLTDVIRVVAHECSHRQQQVIIKGIKALEDMGIDCERIECFSVGAALKEAGDNYSRDSLDFDGYKENLLEKESEKYAKKMIERLKEKGYLK